MLPGHTPRPFSASWTALSRVWPPDEQGRSPHDDAKHLVLSCQPRGTGLTRRAAVVPANDKDSCSPPWRNSRHRTRQDGRRYGTKMAETPTGGSRCQNPAFTVARSDRHRDRYMNQGNYRAKRTADPGIQEICEGGCRGQNPASTVSAIISGAVGNSAAIVGGGCLARTTQHDRTARTCRCRSGTLRGQLAGSTRERFAIVDKAHYLGSLTRDLREEQRHRRLTGTRYLGYRRIGAPAPVAAGPGRGTGVRSTRCSTRLRVRSCGNLPHAASTGPSPPTRPARHLDAQRRLRAHRDPHGRDLESRPATWLRVGRARLRSPRRHGTGHAQEPDRAPWLSAIVATRHRPALRAPAP